MNLIATANTGYTFLNWTENGNIVSTDASYSFIAICDSNLVANFELTSLIKEDINNLDIKVYPNPVFDELVIEILGNDETQNFEILNTNGQVIFKGRIAKKTTVLFSNYASGVYYIKLEDLSAGQAAGKVFEFIKVIKE